jgi:predicted dehydrogenase
VRTFDIAIVGTGGIAAVHAEALSTMDGRARVVAAVNRNEASLVEFGQRFAVRSLHHDVADLLASVRPDLVHLCTAPALHIAQATECLRVGVPVLCEKPPALSLAEFDAIIDAAMHAGADFATIFQHRFGSGARALAGLVREGTLGAPTTVVCHTLWHRPDDYFAVPWRGTWESEGGGPTMGHGIHQMDLMLSVLGPWREVVAVADRRLRRTETEDLSAAIVTFDKGAVATVVNSVVSPRGTTYLRFDFADATVELSHLYGYGDSDWVATGAPGLEEKIADLWASRLDGVRSGHRAQFRAVFDALEAGAPLPVTAAESRSTMELVTAIYASAFTGRPVHRGEIRPESPFYHRMDGQAAPWQRN